MRHKKMAVFLALFIVFQYIFSASGLTGIASKVFAAEKQTYISDIMLSIAEDSGTAKDQIERCGYKMIDEDVLDGINGFSYSAGKVYIGYKTTTNKKYAITDIRTVTLTEDEMEEESVQYVYNNGNTNYMACPVYYQDARFSRYTGIYGISTNDSANLTVGDYFEHICGKIAGLFGNYSYGVSAGMAINEVVDFVSFGAFSAAIDEVMEADYGYMLYWTRGTEAGDPITNITLEDHVMNTSTQTTVSDFCSEIPYNLCDARRLDVAVAGSGAGNKERYLVAERAVTEASDSGTEYVSQIIQIVDDDYFLSGLDLDYLSAPMDYSGYIRIPGTSMAYKTTRDKRKALTNVKVMDKSDSKFIMHLMTIGSAGYASAAIVGSDEKQVIVDGTNAIKHAYMPDQLIYTTTNVKEGNAIKASDIGAVSSVGEIPAGFKAPDPVLGVGARSVGGMYLTFPGEQSHDKKYISNIAAANYTVDLLGLFGTDDGATFDKVINRLLQNGCTNYYETEVGIGTYIGYDTSDDPDDAITGLYLYHNGNIEISTDLNDIGNMDVYVETGGAPPKSVMPIRRDVYYTLESGACNTNLRKTQGERRFLYYSKNPTEGDPITALGFSTELYDGMEKPIANLLDPALSDKHSGYNESLYLTISRDVPGETRQKYISEIAFICEDWDLFLDEAKKYLYSVMGMDFVLDKDLNEDAGIYADRVYMGYDKTTNVNEAITGIVAVHNEERTPTRIINGIEYTIVGGFYVDYTTWTHEPSGYGFDGPDLNRDAGGDDIFFYYTKDPAAGAPIVDVDWGRYAMRNNGWESVKMLDGRASNVQQGASDWDEQLYVFYLRGEDIYKPYIKDVVVAADTSYYGCLDDLTAYGAQYYVPFDYNYATGQEYVMIGYTRTDNPDEAITNMVARRDDGFSWYYNYGGIEYEAVSDIDFNIHSGGSYIYLYYTKDKSAGAPLTGIDGQYEPNVEVLGNKDYFKKLWEVPSFSTIGYDYAYEVENYYYSMNNVNWQTGNPSNMSQGATGRNEETYIGMYRRWNTWDEAVSQAQKTDLTNVEKETQTTIDVAVIGGLNLDFLSMETENATVAATTTQETTTAITQDATTQKTTTQEATTLNPTIQEKTDNTTASMFGKGSLIVLAVIALMGVGTGTWVVIKKKREQ